MEVEINASDNRVACGVALIVTHRQRVLFGKRVTKSTDGEWQLPGGWIAAGESPREAALRELREETGLNAQALRFVGITSNRFSPDRQSISLYFETECTDVETLHRAEPDKCLAWEWKAWDDVGENLYLPLRLLRLTGYRPFAGPAGDTWVSL